MNALSATDVTTFFFFEVARARRFIRKHRGTLTMPVLMALSEHDPICDNPANRRLFEALPSPDKRLEQYPSRHILEFSPEKEAFFSDLGRWLESQSERKEG